MAKAVYVGVGSKARKMKKAYIGIGGKARKVKKMYIGDSSGKARLCYSAELEKVGMAENLSDERCTVAASVGNYALFAGGYGYWRYSAVIYDAVDAYSASLTKSMPTALSTVRESHAGASVEGYALFAGGANGTRSTDIVDSVDAYSASLTRTAAATLSGKRKWIGAASLEGRAFFAGGASTNLNSNTKCANVEVYNGTLTRTAATNLSVARYSPLTATIGGRVLFAGGDFTKVVDVYSASLTRTAAADLSRSTSGGDASIAVGNYAIFTSGLVVGSDGVGSFVGNTSCDVYNASLTKTTVTLLSVARVYMSAGTVGDYALFAGGGSNSPYSDVVDACDTSLTRTTVTALDYPRRNLSSATVGDYLLFAGGGRDYDDPSSVVFVYTA